MAKHDVDWDLYRTFLAVLQTGSLSAAARRLNLSQPTVGRHIEALEQAAGFPLFTRSQSGLQPTEAALTLQPYAESMAATAAALARATSASPSAVEGTVRISASEIVAVEVLPPILAKLGQAHPKLEIELSASDAVEDLLHRQADIALRMTEPVQAALVVRHLGDIPIGFFAHRAYLARRGTPQSLADLTDHDVIGYDKNLAYVRDVMRNFPGVALPRFHYRADSNTAQLAMLRAGCGIGLCQRQLGLRDPNLVEILEGVLPIRLPIWAAMHENLRNTPRCRAAFDALVGGMLQYVRSL
ncbi:LysR family transcriptional regulator [Rhizobium sp. PAMB 3182]